MLLCTYIFLDRAIMNIINKKHMNLELQKDSFVNASPFPHIILDDFLDPAYFLEIQRILDNNKDSISGRNFETEYEHNKWISLNSALPDAVKNIVTVLTSDNWVKNLISLSGIKTLQSTPHGNTKLANYHTMEPGGILTSHVDHSSEPVSGIPHVMNIIIYLTKDWDLSNGGGTLLYDKTGKHVIKKVEYKGNRAVLFLHTPYSFHGVEKIDGSSPKNRKTIYVDYYSSSFIPYKDFDLNFANKWFYHGTVFKLKSIFQYFNIKGWLYTKANIQYHLNRYKSKLK